MRLQIPRGVKDFLPEEASWKSILEGKIREEFNKWGYAEVTTPTFEYFTNLKLGESTFEQTYKFLGQDGNLLALRPDITTPIARMVATRFKAEPKPLRFGYLANVFRYDEVQVGKQREFYQAGVELIGSKHAAADGEVIALAAAMLQAVGLVDFQFDIGQVQYFNGLMEDCDCKDITKRVREALLRKDYVGLREVVNNSDLPTEACQVLLELPTMRGGREILSMAREKTTNVTARQAVDNLEQIYRSLEAYGVADYVQIDLGMIKSLDYYTGMVLEGYSPGLGFTLCTGGRYDNLISQFGADTPATGMAMGLERLMLALERHGAKPKFKVPEILVLPADLTCALTYAQNLRNLGHRVEVDVQGFSEKEALAYGKERGISRVVVVGEDGVVELTRRGDNNAKNCCS